MELTFQQVFRLRNKFRVIRKLGIMHFALAENALVYKEKRAGLLGAHLNVARNFEIYIVLIYKLVFSQTL